MIPELAWASGIAVLLTGATLVVCAYASAPGVLFWVLGVCAIACALYAYHMISQESVALHLVVLTWFAWILTSVVRDDYASDPESAAQRLMWLPTQVLTAAGLACLAWSPPMLVGVPILSAAWLVPDHRSSAFAQPVPIAAIRTGLALLVCVFITYDWHVFRRAQPTPRSAALAWGRSVWVFLCMPAMLPLAFLLIVWNWWTVHDDSAPAPQAAVGLEPLTHKQHQLGVPRAQGIVSGSMV